MNPYTLHISLCDLAFLGAIFTALNFALLLAFTKRISRSANKFLALALIVMVLWMVRISAIDIRLPLQFSLALGPLIYFYVLKLTRPEYKFSRKHLLHFIPALLEQFTPLKPLWPFLIFISIITYLYCAHRLIERFYRRQKFNGGDRYRYELRWLHKLLAGFSLLWLLWIPLTIVGYFYYHHPLSVQAYYPFYLCVAAMLIGMAATAYLRPEVSVHVVPPAFLKLPLPAEQKEKGAWLKNVVKTNLYYQDPELSLVSLAEKLGLTTHELSRLLNNVLKKSFNDFINEYRVAEVIRRMQDPAYDHLTLLGISYDAGFNSKSTFNLLFKKITGKTPAEYKAILKKELLSYNLGRSDQWPAIISNYETTCKWSEEKLNRNYMFKNYLKIAWRNLTRNKVSSLINIGGLAIGMAVSFILLTYIYNEFSFDKFNVNSERLYRVLRNQSGNGELVTNPTTPVPLASALLRNYPEIDNAARTNWPDDFLMNYKNQAIKVTTMAADPSLLNMFSFPFISGDKQKALSDPSSIVLTESVAKALFGNRDPVGITIKVNNQSFLKVSAVIRDNPANSSFVFKALISWQAFEAAQPGVRTSGWGNYFTTTYVMLKPGSSLTSVNEKLKNIIGQNDPKDKENTIFLYPFAKYHLYSDFKNGVNAGGKIESIRLFLLLALGILLIACINFMNLSTARSGRRSREVGVRKAVGARRFALIQQFMIESMLTAFLAFALSLVIVILLIPSVNTILNIQLIVPYNNLLIWCCTLGITAFAGLIAGSYPAFFLSDFNPAEVLKGQLIAIKATVKPRQTLVVVQFSFAVCLILSSIFIYKQINFIKNKPVGYNRNGLIEMPVEGSMNKRFENFRLEAINAGAITEGTMTSSSLVNNGSSTWGVKWNGQLPGEDKLSIDQMAATYHFINTYGLKLIQGRDFSVEFPSDSLSIILNQAAVKLMRFKEPIVQMVKFQGKDCKVIGVVENFVWGSPYESVKPAIIGFSKGWTGNIALRLNPGKSVSASLNLIQRIYKKYNPEYPFAYTFTDDSFNNKFKAERLLGGMSAGFTCLAILISCLGLFGLASFSAEQRKKEIGIRKLLGATIGNLWFNLSKEFVGLVIISFAIGSAISWYYVHQWLNKYAFRTDLSFWVFLITLLLSLAICLLTVSWQAINAALTNPVKSLRSE